MRNALVDILEKAKEKLSDPACWTKGALARDKSGKYCSPESPNAVSWNVDGVFEEVFGDRFYSMEVHVARHILYEAIPDPACATDMWRWNDKEETTHDDIMSLFDRAIELAGKKRKFDYLS